MKELREMIDCPCCGKETEVFVELKEGKNLYYENCEHCDFLFEVEVKKVS